MLASTRTNREWRPVALIRAHVADHPAGIAVLAGEIGAALDRPVDERSSRIVTALQLAAATPDLLSAQQTTACAQSYARHVLHADRDGRFTILALVWGPGQFSPVHAHHTWCAYAVHANVLTETLYSYDPDIAAASPLRTAERRAGYGCHGEAGLDQIHRLGNDHDRPAISIHIYGVDGANVTTGVNRVMAEGRPRGA